MIAGGIYGPARSALGAPRDFTIGLRVVMADGRITRAGGKVVKNVAGYDLCKLYAGSLGTLGVIVEASLKAIPAPPVQACLTMTLPSAEEPCSLVRKAVRSGLSVQSAAVQRVPNGWHTAITLAGTPAGVDRSHREIAAEAGMTLTEDPGSATDHRELPQELVITVQPSAVPGLLTNCANSLEGEVSIEAWPAVGACVLRSSADEGLIATCEKISTAAGGHMTINRCPPLVKHNRDGFGAEPSSLELMRRIKDEFDPKAILSPGRAAGRI